MKTFLKLLATLCAVAVGVACAMATEVVAKVRRDDGLDDDAMLAAIRMVESENNPAAIGKLGERSAYQFTRTTWMRFSSAPYVMATTNPAHADAAARVLLASIKRELHKQAAPLRPEFIAALWRHGEHAPLVHCADDHAQRAANLYAETVRAKQRRLSK